MKLNSFTLEIFLKNFIYMTNLYNTIKFIFMCKDVKEFHLVWKTGDQRAHTLNSSVYVTFQD